MIWVRGVEYGTAVDIAARLGITPARVRDWARRSRTTGDRLEGLLPGRHLPGRGRGTTWYCLGNATYVEMLTRTSGRGAPRAELTWAA